MNMRRAYSILNVKAQREDDAFVYISGMATTPTPDRSGDIVEPMGAKFATPMPLLWQHDSHKPVGHMTFAKPTKKGIPFEARIPKVAEAGVLKDRVDEAIQSLRYGLVAAVSIGFKPVWEKVEELAAGALRFVEWEWLELSLVTIPMNSEATITSVKSIDERLLRERAATGRNVARSGVVRLSLPGDSGQQGNLPKPETKGSNVNIREQIQNFQNKRAATLAVMETVMSKSVDEGRTLSAEEQEEYDNAATEIKAIDAHLKRLGDHERAMVSRATVVDNAAGTDGDVASETRGGSSAAAGAGRTAVQYGDGVIRTNRNLPKGIAFTRYAMSLMVAKGNLHGAEQYARQKWGTSTPEVANVLQFAAGQGSSALTLQAMQQKAAVAAGTVSDSSWAGPLVQYDNMASEFVELLRPKTIIGRVQGFRRVPFYVRIPRQTAGVSGYFVGEGAPKPLSALAFDSLTMEPFKAAVIVVMTQELMKFSSPSSEQLVRDDMVNGIVQFLDERFIDPQYVGNASSPASITNSATPITVGGSTIALTDAAIESALQGFLTANMDTASLVWIMSPIVALSISMKRNANDEYAYPTLTMNGGTWMGIPVITSNAAVLAGSPTEAFIVLLDASSVLMADEGGVDIDMSTEASVEMSNTPTGGATSLRSLWQNNLVGLRAERFVNWKARRANPAAVLRYNLSPGAV